MTACSVEEGDRKMDPKASASLTCLHPGFLVSHTPPPPAVPTLRTWGGGGAAWEGAFSIQ